MLVTDFLADYGSTTTSFKQMSNDYALDILANGFHDDYFYRIVAIYVDKIGVMLGVSVTSRLNHTFLDILQNAQHIPIGVQLFDPKNKITRTNVSIKQINVSSIIQKTVVDYLNTHHVTGQIYVRQSNFVKDNETMELIEYILPGLEQLLNKYKDQDKC